MWKNVRNLVTLYRALWDFSLAKISFQPSNWTVYSKFKSYNVYLRKKHSYNSTIPPTQNLMVEYDGIDEISSFLIKILSWCLDIFIIQLRFLKFIALEIKHDT